MKKIIIYCEIDWQFLDQRHHHLARYFAKKGYSVEFVQRVVGRIPGIKHLLVLLFRKLLNVVSPAKETSTPVKALPDNIRLRRSWYLPHTYRLFAWYNYLVWWCIERPRQADAMIYSFVDNPYIIGKKYHRLGKWQSSVFDIIHNWWDFPWKVEIHRQYADFCVEAFDHIVTDSQKIVEKLQSRDIPLHLMLPGISEAWLDCDRTSSPTEVKAVFFGNLRTNSDIPLINQIAERYGIDLYGIIDPDVQSTLSSSASFCGRVDSEALPRILLNYNVIVLPYNNSGFSASISPAKFYEALAAGCAVVTRADLSHVIGFTQFCVHLQTLEEVEQLNTQLLSSESAKEQQAFAARHTWSQRFDALCDFIGLSNV